MKIYLEMFSLIILSLFLEGCFAPTIAADVCKSNIVRNIKIFAKTPTSGRFFSDDLSDYKEFDRLVRNLITSIDEKDCRKETLLAVSRLKVTAQKLHNAVVAYEDSRAGSPARASAEKEIFSAAEELAKSFNDIQNS